MKTALFVLALFVLALVAMAHGPGIPPDPWDDGTCQSVGECPTPTTLGNCGDGHHDPCPDDLGKDVKGAARVPFGIPVL